MVYLRMPVKSLCPREHTSCRIGWILSLALLGCGGRTSELPVDPGNVGQPQPSTDASGVTGPADASTSPPDTIIASPKVKRDCLPDGSPLNSSDASACCSGHANSGFCGGLGPLMPGDRCYEASECLTYSCVDGYCPGAMCTAGGAKCTDDAACCSHQCNDGLCAPLAHCKTAGAQCASDAECCEASCRAGLCGGGCKVGVAPCTSQAECCASECTNGLCDLADPGCPAVAGSCGGCLPLNCCSDVSLCLKMPACASALDCFHDCRGGASAAACVAKCALDATSEGRGLAHCAANRCAGSCR